MSEENEKDNDDIVCCRCWKLINTTTESNNCQFIFPHWKDKRNGKIYCTHCKPIVSEFKVLKILKKEGYDKQ